jgi:hypothetical protein
MFEIKTKIKAEKRLPNVNRLVRRQCRRRWWPYRRGVIPPVVDGARLFAEECQGNSDKKKVETSVKKSKIQ